MILEDLKDMIPEDFKVGDIVTRDGTDEYEVISTRYDAMWITVKCIKEPAIFEGANEPWIHIGQIESNMARRYSLVRHRGPSV
jgi:hypothetical protein